MSRHELEPLTLRVTDQETARVVAVHDLTGRIVGAGCLVSANAIITCKHVVAYARGPKRLLKKQAVKSISITLIGVGSGTSCVADVIDSAEGDEPENDLCLLRIKGLEDRLQIAPIEFVTPLRHGRKSFSVLGFPNSDPQGENAIGILQAADAKGLIQMDGKGALLVEGGFSGAPVWSSDLGGFVGLVVAELNEKKVAWCIPSRRIAAFYRELDVRFRIPHVDRPRIHDYHEDDPNLQLFGTVGKTPSRQFTANIKKVSSKKYRVNLVYKTLDGTETMRGGSVTFVTHPSFGSRAEDAYELFSRLDKAGVAKNHFWCRESFTVAAIGDAGDTALTVDLSKCHPLPPGFK